MDAKKLTSFLVFIIVAAMAIPAAGAKDRPAKERKPFELKRHEFTLTTGFGPGQYYLGGYRYDYVSGNGWASYESYADDYYLKDYYDKEYTSGVWAVGYTYNFTKILSLQTHAFFEMGWSNHFKREEGARPVRSHDIYVSVMPSFKVHWFNRNWVRMYSYAGVGISYNAYLNNHVRGTDTYYKRNRLIAVGQFTPIGITVGKSFYGLAEIGIGSYFSGIAFGLGYRF